MKNSSKDKNFIRKATKNDASRIAEIFIFSKRCAFRNLFQNDFTAFNEMQVLDLALYYRDTEHVLDDVYVYDDGIVKGVMTLDPSEDQNSSRYLKELYIEPFFQKQGIGSALLNYFLDKAKEDDMTSVFLWVMEKNVNARSFYEHFNFKCVNERKIIEGTPCYLIKYTKDI